MLVLHEDVHAMETFLALLALCEGNPPSSQVDYLTKG